VEERRGLNAGVKHGDTEDTEKTNSNGFLLGGPVSPWLFKAINVDQGEEHCRISRSDFSNGARAMPRSVMMAVIFFDHLPAFIEHRILNVADDLAGWRSGEVIAGDLAGDALDALEGPDEIDRGRAAGGEIAADIFQAGEELLGSIIDEIPHAKVCAERGGDSDGRCAAHDKAADGIVHLLFIGDVDVDCFRGEPGLIEQADGSSGPGDGSQHGGIVGILDWGFWILDWGVEASIAALQNLKSGPVRSERRPRVR